MGDYKSKTEFGREEGLLEDKEKIKMAENVGRIEREKEKRQGCKSSCIVKQRRRGMNTSKHRQVSCMKC